MLTRSSLFGAPYCLILPESLEGKWSIEAGSCDEPIQSQQPHVDAVANEVMKRAGTRGLSPRDPALLTEVSNYYSNGLNAAPHSAGFQVGLQMNPPYGGTVFWCVTLPET